MLWRMALQLHWRGSMPLFIQAAQRPRSAGGQRPGDECQRLLRGGMNSTEHAGPAQWSSVQTYDTFSDDPE